ncbi:MAG: hypothetical protein VKN15_00745 [Cyanobacteriota bacterium]|nr:hypothetical protein [Cyanobacteriota bacterium]
MAALPGFLQRWNFIERARLERQLWDAYERGDDLDALLASEAPGFRQEVWTTTLGRIRKIENLMRDQQGPKD